MLMNEKTHVETWVGNTNFYNEQCKYTKKPNVETLGLPNPKTNNKTQINLYLHQIIHRTFQRCKYLLFVMIF